MFDRFDKLQERVKKLEEEIQILKNQKHVHYLFRELVEIGDFRSTTKETTTTEVILKTESEHKND